MARPLPKIPGIAACPFCGYVFARISTRNIQKRKDSVRRQKYYVTCHKCHAKGPYADTESEAMLKWNTHTPSRIAKLA